MHIAIDPEGSVDGDLGQTLKETYQGYLNYPVGNAMKPLNCINLYYVQEQCVAGYNVTVSGTLVNFVYTGHGLDGAFRLDGDGVLRGRMRNTKMQVDFPVAITLR